MEFCFSRVFFSIIFSTIIGDHPKPKAIFNSYKATDSELILQFLYEFVRNWNN